MANNGIDRSMVAYLLDHTSPKTTEKFYIQKNSEKIKEKLDNLDINFMEDEKSANGLLTDSDT